MKNQDKQVKNKTPLSNSYKFYTTTRKETWQEFITKEGRSSKEERCEIIWEVSPYFHQISASNLA